MTKADLVDWLKACGCEQEPIEGPNVTGCAIKMVNKKSPNKLYIYIDTPIDDSKPLPEYAIAHACMELQIDSPDCAKAHKKVVSDIKERFSPKGK